MSDDTDGAGQKAAYGPFAIPRRKVERFDQAVRDLPPHLAHEAQPEDAETVHVNGYDLTMDQFGWVMGEYLRLKAAENWDWDPVRMGGSIDDDQDDALNPSADAP